MTDIEILTNCINEMARINIPAGLIEQIGLPIYNIREELINLANSIIEKANKVEKNEDSKIEAVKDTVDNQNGSEVE